MGAMSAFQQSKERQIALRECDPEPLRAGHPSYYEAVDLDCGPSLEPQLHAGGCLQPWNVLQYGRLFGESDEHNLPHGACRNVLLW